MAGDHKSSTIFEVNSSLDEKILVEVVFCDGKTLEQSMELLEDVGAIRRMVSRQSGVTIGTVCIIDDTRPGIEDAPELIKGQAEYRRAHKLHRILHSLATGGPALVNQVGCLLDGCQRR
jgi:hypothetical protein